MTTTEADSIRHLSVAGGTIAYTVRGDGPLVLLSPGLGDVRASFRAMAPYLVAAGYRVATADLRGHGDSSSGFASYGDDETAGDLAALLDQLGAPAIIVGNSLSAGAAVVLAARRPELVAGLILIGPFVRDQPTSRFTRLLLRIALWRPWAALTWRSYLPSLYAGRKPDDFDAYRRAVGAAMRRPGHAAAFSLTARTSHASAAEALARVAAPSLIVMGDKDPDFPDPGGEADWIAAQIGGDVILVAEAGHYPHAQQPDTVNPAVLRFINEVTPSA
jgi:pimeloyl-ACP methyl ester carboxylesterase